MTLRVADSITAFAPDDWDRCFPGELETWGYYRATEDAGLEGFTFRYYGLEEDGQLLAAVPGFRMTYRLDTTVKPGRIKSLLERLTLWFPKIMILRMAALGSPVAERCHLGFAPEVSETRHPALLALLRAAFEQDAAEAGYSFLVIKDAPEAEALWRNEVVETYGHMASLPTAWLPIEGPDLDGYLKTLSKATRKNVRRKLKSRNEVRVEFRQEIGDILPLVSGLYQQALERSGLQFENLPAPWFTLVSQHMGETAGYFLYWVGSELAGFNLVLQDSTRLLDKFVGFDGVLGPQHNLYVLSWMVNVEHCLEKGLTIYQSGQDEYATKRHLGCRFAANDIWFRHARPIPHLLLRLASRILRFDRHDPDLAAVLEAQQ
jgi:predicted N-acyltransferase